MTHSLSNRRVSLSLRIRLAFLALGLTAIALTGVLALRVAEDALETATFERLTGIRETKKRQVETYLSDATAFVEALGRDESAVDALMGFEAAWPPGSPDYTAVRALHHEGLAGLAAALGFEDLLLIGIHDLRILYSASESEQVGNKLDEPPLMESTLATAAEAVARGGSDGGLADFSLFPTESGVGAFAMAPIVAEEGTIGVVAARLSISKIDEVMTGGGSWREEGLGESGETYLVGRDRLMRSDSRFLTQSQERYLAQLEEFGAPAERIERIRRRGTTVLTQEVTSRAVERALAGETATDETIDYRGVLVLSSFAPLDTPGLGWVLLAEIDKEEAFAPVAGLRRQVLWLGAGVSLAFLGVGYLFSRRTTEPLLALTREVERLGGDDWRELERLEAFEKADDEVARLAQQFDEVSRRLRETTVSRDYLDDLLASILNAVFTVGPVDEAGSPIRVRSANPAAAALLGYEPEQLADLPLERLLGSGSARPRWVETLLREGRTPAVEKALRTRDGRMIPVLFTAAQLGSRSRAGEMEAVCVAQDIADLKTAEHRLQALARRLITAQEEERSRLARELHDDVTQRLGTLAIDAGKLAQSREGEDAGLRDLQERAITLAHDVQGLSRRLHPSILDDLGLAAALRTESQALGRRLGVPVSFAAEELPESFPRESATALYRIAQECFQNIVRHARASEVNVELSVLDGQARLRIEDDGAGFRPGEARSRGGLGLASLSERARLAGGRLEIRSAPGEGAKITAEIPLENVTR